MKILNIYKIVEKKKNLFINYIYDITWWFYNEENIWYSKFKIFYKDKEK